MSRRERSRSPLTQRERQDDNTRRQRDRHKSHSYHQSDREDSRKRHSNDEHSEDRRRKNYRDERRRTTDDIRKPSHRSKSFDGRKERASDPKVNRRRDHRRQREEETEEDLAVDTTTYEQRVQPDESSNNSTKTEEPNFGLSGKLTEYTNTYKGVVIKYNEPPEARKPKTRWRLYPFKGEETLPVLYIHRQSAFLLGRQRHIADIPIDHPSCSKQHAVLQYKLGDYQKPDGSTGRKVKPYIIDLESANGTYLNNERIDARRYYELKERDVLKFGFSSREYVMLHERSLNTGANQEPESDSNNESPD